MFHVKRAFLQQIILLFVDAKPSAHVQAFQLSLVCCFVVCCFAAMSSGKFPLRGVAIVVPAPRCFCGCLVLGDKWVFVIPLLFCVL